ncbi:LOW QUALITY PROTEIN: hypothetical protein Smp_127500 [Schistosoma mansoni]|uniref:hypothetical protein n=1 Tax=Schistosoma mansoni TaxID=6183 RepID=UPI00022DC573|nr:LOW QUALITY PROTEIN: hypothetical protein Smp_127500 [Schistosoma mansoni]|eukprot:XP_018651062.1 LOW QUALITY PROTEIN: hypothetical protein Smp_127500 [Schistosoma mansoni]
MNIVDSQVSEYFLNVDTQDCFGLPEKPFIIFGAVVSHTRAIGRTLCYFQPSDQNQYLSIYPTKLILPSQFGTCPVIQIKEFTSVRDELIDNSDVNMIIPMKVPDDTKLIFQANCTNYLSMLDKVVHTSSSNLKIQILFDPANSAASDVAYQFVISSYGPSYNCPSDTFRCWDAATNCIPDSLTCDTIANCHDGSDENGYLCTGRINGIPIPLFAIIITISIFGLILLVLTIVFVIRKQRKHKRKTEQTIAPHLEPLNNYKLNLITVLKIHSSFIH